MSIIFFKKVVSRKTEKVLQDNCQENHDCCLFYINPLPQSYCYKLHMNQQSPECQLINRLNNACVKINLCKHIVITSCQIYTIHEMQQLCVVQKTSPNIHVSFDCFIRVY